MKLTSWYVAMSVLVLGGAVAAATLNDFKDAAGREDCASIPYDGYRSSCKGSGEKVDEWCKNENCEKMK